MIVADVRRPCRCAAIDHAEPLAGVDLVGAELGADLVVEYLGGSTWQAAEARLDQPLQKRFDRQAQGRRTLMHFQRREGVDVHARHLGFDRT